MITTLTRTSLVLALALSLTACGAVRDGSRAPFWTAAIIVLVALALVAWFMQRHKS